MPTTEEDIAYYRRRIDACAEQAGRAESLSARSAHEALARLYREKLRALGAEPPASDEPGTIRQAADEAASRSRPREF